MTKIVLTLRKAEPTVQTRQTDKKSPEKAGFAFFGDFVLAEGLGGGARQREKRNRPFSAGMTDKDPTEKALFANTFGSVLAEELGGEARHQSAEQYIFSL